MAKKNVSDENAGRLEKSLKAIQKERRALHKQMNRSSDLVAEMKVLKVDLEAARKTLPENPKQITALMKRLKGGISALGAEVAVLYKRMQSTQRASEKLEDEVGKTSVPQKNGK